MRSTNVPMVALNENDRRCLTMNVYLGRIASGSAYLHG
jgi:hypothetical protein